MMVGIEDILCELATEEINGCPPGFRFHPTDEELVSFYLASKVLHGSTLLCPVDVIIPEVDLNKCEPWELPYEAKMGKREWYFYSLRDRKYPTGLRTNRATTTGYWKATGKDKEIYAGGAGGGGVIGMKKTLVFYLGRAPRGEKTKWVMHEYRLHPRYFIICAAPASSKDEWVICRMYKKTGEKKNMLIIEIGTCSMPRNESLFPDAQLSGQFLQNQASAFVAGDYMGKHNSTQMLFNNTSNDYIPALTQSQLGSLFPAYSFRHESSSGNNPTIIAAATANPTPTVFKSLNSTEVELQAKISRASSNPVTSNYEQVKTETNYFSTQPHLMLTPAEGRGAGYDLEWFHELQQASSTTTQINSHKVIVPQATNSDMDSSRGGCCLQMVVDPKFRFPKEGELPWPLDA